MAVGGLPASLPQSVPSPDQGRVQRAQAAFFQAALGNVAPVAAPPSEPAPAAPQPPPKAAAPDEPQPARNYRPGMLLDIRI